MTAFLIAAAALTAAVLVRLLLPLLRSARQRQTLSQQQLNAAVYREQLKELERDLASGTLSQAHYDEARDELQRRLLHDVSGPAAPAAAEAAPRRAGLATVIGRAAGRRWPVRRAGQLQGHRLHTA
jgi:cytochrome c-type biogenesis protein CcmH